jgi:hypothetical protein
MAIKNSSLSHQHSFFKIKNARRLSLEKRLTTLKLNFNANSGEILRTERELNNVTEQDLREEIQKMKHFEKLNNEKITPYFLSLAKKPHNSESLSDINNNDGTPFENPKQRSDYITDYYASAYRCIPNVRNNTPIADFLGDVANHPSVLGSKLSNDEHDDLEQELTLPVTGWPPVAVKRITLSTTVSRDISPNSTTRSLLCATALEIPCSPGESPITGYSALTK